MCVWSEGSWESCYRCMKDKGQLVDISSLLPIESWRLNLGPTLGNSTIIH